MRDKRMFSNQIVMSDAFLDMPMSARCLYFTLAMLADDDGFINSPKSIMRQCGCSEDDLKVLIAKKFIIPFESGVVVIKHWRIHNYIQSDRYKPTAYQDEYNQLTVEENKSYSVSNLYPTCIQSVSKMDTQYKENKNKENIKEIKENTYGQNQVIEPEVLTENEVRFNEFWTAYPRKVKKQDAQKAFNKVCTSEETFRLIMDGLRRQLPTWKDPQYIPHPTTWLNGKRWEDEPQQKKGWTFSDIIRNRQSNGSSAY